MHLADSKEANNIVHLLELEFKPEVGVGKCRVPDLRLETVPGRLPAREASWSIRVPEYRSIEHLIRRVLWSFHHVDVVNKYSFHSGIVLIFHRSRSPYKHIAMSLPTCRPSLSNPSKPCQALVRGTPSLLPHHSQLLPLAHAYCLEATKQHQAPLAAFLPGKDAF